jgi:hypothetical protein
MDLSYMRYNQHGGEEPDDDVDVKPMYHDIGEIETRNDSVRFRCVSACALALVRMHLDKSCPTFLRSKTPTLAQPHVGAR